MATAPQAAMEMPQQGANPFADPKTMAVYDQLRQTTSPKQFGDEMLAGASQIDPQAVAEFLEELQSMEIPPEILDTLNDLVDEILANPERYPELRKQYMAQGLPEDILPEQFDPQFFAALNMAIDQMIAEPSGVQAFAQGGIAELKPIAKAIASYGRNGDTMLAHITPAEARMLRRRGGSGTINPTTGLPEFANIFQKIGKAVKKFASSTVGRIITTVALGFFLGPAAAGLLGVTSAVGVAAVSGFIGSAGATLLGGGNIGQALKAGVVGGLTAGAGSGLTGGSFASGTASTAGMTAGEAVSSQFNKFTNAFTPSAAAPVTPIDTGLSSTGTAPVPSPDPLGDFIQSNDAARTAANTPIGIKSVAGPSPSPDPLGDFIQQNDAARTAANTPARLPVGQTASAQPGAYKVPTVTDSFAKMGEGLGMGDAPASYETFKQGATDLFSPGPTNAQQLSQAQEIMRANPGTSLKDAMVIAKDMGPSMLRTYAPAAVAGLGTMAAFGGFNSKPVEPGDTTRSLRKPVTQRIAEEGTQRQMYMQGLPGVVYDDYGAPVYGQSTRLPTYGLPDYNSGGYGLPQGQGGISMPAIYIPPPGSIGSSSVAQPYNTSSMYSNLVPRQYAEGGYAEGGAATGTTVTDLYRSILRREPSPGEIDWWNTQFAGTIGERERAVFRSAAAPELAGRATEQKTARDAAAQQSALRKSQGSGQMYGNINAGLAALAPESDPMDSTSVEGLYRSILRREPDAGGLAFWKSTFGDTVDEQERAAFRGAAAPEIAARNNFVGEAPYQSPFGANNRAAGLARLQTAYGPMLQSQRDAMAKQKAILTNTGTTTGSAGAGGGAAMSAEQPFPMPRFTNAGKQPPDFPGFDDQTRFGLPLPTRQPSGMPVGFTPMPTPDYPGGQIGHLGIDEYGRGAFNGFGGPPPVGGVKMNEGPGYQDPNKSGIAALAQGGYPRRNGQINGPGTEKSDSIPAMLSDGEFVMTAKAVRGAGKGSRRAGAKKMYALMHQLEKNSERG